MCINPVHWLSTHVVACILILIFIYMVLFKGLSRTNGGSGFMKIVALVLFAAAAYTYFVQKAGSAAQLLPGFAGTVAQGTERAMGANGEAYDKCLTNAVIATGLVPRSKQYCSNTRTVPEWEKCMGSTVLCSQGGDAGCLRKTECDAQAEGSIPQNLLQGILRAILAPLVGLLTCK
jgi:hypothetical protein